MKPNRILDADGHIIERDIELFEYLEPPYKGKDTLLGYPFFPTLDGYNRGALLARLGLYQHYEISAKVWIDALDKVGIESTVLYPTAGLAFNLFAPSALVRGFSFIRILARYGERLAGHDATLRLLSELRGWLFARLFPRLPLAVRWRMALLYALLAVHERFPLTPRRRAYALAEMAPEPDSVQSSTRVHELLTQIEASRVEAREAAPGAAELVRQDRDER